MSEKILKAYTDENNQDIVLLEVSGIKFEVWLNDHPDVFRGIQSLQDEVKQLKEFETKVRDRINNNGVGLITLKDIEQIDQEIK